MPNCKNCQNSFNITAEDQAFYKKMDVLEPTFCPLCRQQRRLAIRNEINLHQRTCDKTGKQIISMYPQNTPYTIYDIKVWWSDCWNALDYGQNFDFNRPFFEQFEELQKKVPRQSLNNTANENSDYTNYAFRNKNSYLIFTADYNEDCFYLRFADKNYRCLDCDFTWESQFCYECIDMHKTNQCAYSQKCESSGFLYFCYDMHNCQNCIFCTNLRNKQYHIFNKKVSREEYEKIFAELRLGTWSGVQEAKKKWQEFKIKQPHKFLETIHNENSLGDYLKDSKNALFCFDSWELFDAKYCTHLYKAQDVYDWDFVGGDGSALCYEMCSSAYSQQNCRFSMHCWDFNTNCTYCDLCLGNENLFGCIGLRKNKYCILNKQYSKEEYEKMVPRIIEHMKKTGEWGEFFPIKMATFGYNESVANEYFPLTREEALSKGYKWTEKEEKETKPQVYKIPDDIKDVKDDITNALLACEKTGKNFKITTQELELYRQLNIPIPRLEYITRHKARMGKRNPRILLKRKCSKCSSPIMTTYQLDNPVPVYCEKCYYAHVD